VSRKFNKFQRNSGCYQCIECGKKTRNTEDEGEVKLCKACYDRASWLNKHNDENHDENPNPHCPFCKEKQR